MINRRAIVALLATIAVLLALNLVKGERRAVAGVQGAAELDVQGSDGEPYVVKWFSHGITNYYRLWSDAQLDEFSREDNGDCDGWVFQGVLVSPTEHPAPVVDGHLIPNSLTIQFADGRVDLVEFNVGDERCTIAGEGSDPFCLGDIDRNGATNFDDLLFVLRDWGVCE